MRIGVVGAGPAGMTFAGRVLKKARNATLNIFDSRPEPFGLVRYGIAPDHPEVRSCTRLFEETLRSPNVSFYGNVKIGEPPLTLSTLVDMHDAVVLCTGMSAPRKLGIPGEDVLNAYTSAQIVGWYNGDPEHSAIQPHLANARRIAIIGHGNVALDVARVFLKPWREFENTTISPNALNTLSQSTVEHVDIIGRRGPLQISFTISELREMFNLNGAKFQAHDSPFVLSEINRFRHIWEQHRSSQRLFTMLSEKYTSTACTDTSISEEQSLRTWSLLFKQYPSAIIGDETVDGINFVDCELDYSPKIESVQQLRSVRDIKNNQKKSSRFAPYDMVVSCIGYKPVSTFGLPLNELGMIDLEDGSGHVRGHPKLYIGGWAATGAQGHLADTFRMARELADVVVSRAESSSELLPLPPELKGIK